MTPTSWLPPSVPPVASGTNRNSRKEQSARMSKVRFFDKRVVKIFLQITSIVSSGVSLAVIFFDIPIPCKAWAALGLVILLALIYVAVWICSNTLNSSKINIDGSTVLVKVGDLFQQEGFKVIAFNEYFDTVVDNRIISEKSLNGIFIQKHLSAPVGDLDVHIENYSFGVDELIDENFARTAGKKRRYQPGTICVYNDFLLTAFSKFDDQNRASLTMQELLGFMINFWDRVNSVYALKSVSTAIFGSGITRIKNHKNISDEDLLKIMLWTFRISEMRFKYPAKLTIVIREDKIDQINLLDIKSARNGV